MRCWDNLVHEDLLTGQGGVCIRSAVEQHRLPPRDEEVAVFHPGVQRDVGQDCVEADRG